MLLTRRNKLKAGAMYFAVFMAFLSGVISIFIILLAFLNNRVILLEDYKNDAYDNAQAGITLLLANPDRIGFNISTPLVTGERKDTILLQKRRWGALTIFSSSASWRGFTFMQIALAGIDFFVKPVGLYVADNDQYISIGGDTYISGPAFVPGLGIRTVYMEGEGYKYDKEVHGTVRYSDRDLPPPAASFIQQGKDLLNGKLSISDTVVSATSIANGAYIFNSFKEKTHVYWHKGKLNLNNVTLDGNIRVQASQSIYLSRTCTLRNILVVAPNIYVEAGFTGSIQAYCADTFLIEKGCHLEYPAFVSLINENTNNTLGVVDENTRIDGGIFMYNVKKSPGVMNLYLNEDTEVNGLVYCKGKVQHKGRINGSLYCNGFFLKTNIGNYSNQIFNAAIDFNNLSQYYAGGTILNDTLVKPILIEWLR